MSPRLFLLRAVEPGLALLPGYMISDSARVMLMAIAGQESNWANRAQVGGPARGYWQFEQAAVEAVLSQTSSLAQAVLDTCNIPITDAMTAIQYNDPLACAFARLLLWFDPAPLPMIGNVTAGFDYYQRCWRPGKPDAARWRTIYPTAASTCTAGIL